VTVRVTVAHKRRRRTETVDSRTTVLSTGKAKTQTSGLDRAGTKLLSVRRPLSVALVVMQGKQVLLRRSLKLRLARRKPRHPHHS
jgi:hypothetical protein